MPVGIDQTLVQSLRDIDPDHLGVSHGSAVSGLGVLEMQDAWMLMSQSPANSLTVPEIHERKYIQSEQYSSISLWLYINTLRLTLLYYGQSTLMLFQLMIKLLVLLVLPYYSYYCINT